MTKKPETPKLKEQHPPVNVKDSYADWWSKAWLKQQREKRKGGRRG